MSLSAEMCVCVCLSSPVSICESLKFGSVSCTTWATKIHPLGWQMLLRHCLCHYVIITKTYAHVLNFKLIATQKSRDIWAWAWAWIWVHRVLGWTWQDIFYCWPQPKHQARSRFVCCYQDVRNISTEGHVMIRGSGWSKQGRGEYAFRCCPGASDAQKSLSVACKVWCTPTTEQTLGLIN